MFGLDFIRRLKPCKWRYKYQLDDGKEHFGFIAQEVDEIASHLEYGFVKIGSDNVYRLNLLEFIGPIVKAIQELDKRIAQIERKYESADKGKLGNN